jgi:hypothetical protein
MFQPIALDVNNTINDRAYRKASYKKRSSLPSTAAIKVSTASSPIPGPFVSLRLDSGSGIGTSGISDNDDRSNPANKVKIQIPGTIYFH